MHMNIYMHTRFITQCSCISDQEIQYLKLHLYAFMTIEIQLWED